MNDLVCMKVGDRKIFQNVSFNVFGTPCMCVFCTTQIKSDLKISLIHDPYLSAKLLFNDSFLSLFVIRRFQNTFIILNVICHRVFGKKMFYENFIFNAVIFSDPLKLTPRRLLYISLSL